MKQYAASPILNDLIEDRSASFATGWGDQFYSVVWNVDKAQGFGLDIWGRIVVVGRELQVPVGGKKFGFQTGTNSYLPFNQGVFYSGDGATNTYRLTDNAYRALILTKALSNISATDCQSLNRVLNNLFPGRGRAYVNDLGSMSIRITFEYFLEPWEKSVMVASGVMPRPAGVQLQIMELPLPNVFGFAEQGGRVAPFNQGTFISEGVLTNAD